MCTQVKSIFLFKQKHKAFLFGQTMYNPHMQQSQYYNQLYGASSSALGSPYYYGYAPRGAFSVPPAQRMPGPSYLYYPTQMEGTSLTYPPTPHPLPSLQPIRHSLPSPSGKCFFPIFFYIFDLLFLLFNHTLLYDLRLRE